MKVEKDAAQNEFDIMQSFPKKVISTPENIAKTLSEMKIGKMEQFIVTLKWI